MADATALLRARNIIKEKYTSDIEQPDFEAWSKIGKQPKLMAMVPPPTDEYRPQACQGCVSGCRARYSVGYGHETKCQVTSWYYAPSRRVARSAEELVEINLRAADAAQRYGLNTYFALTGLHWLEHLVEEGRLAAKVVVDGCKVHFSSGGNFSHRGLCKTALRKQIFSRIQYIGFRMPCHILLIIFF